MDAEIVHVTDHAWVRWRERASETQADCNAYTIIQAVREARRLEKNEPIPYGMPRKANSVYAVKDDILFILEPVTKTEFRLVTVITDTPRKLPVLAKTKKQRKERERQLQLAQLKALNPDAKFMTATEEHDALMAEKERIESVIAMTPKKNRSELQEQLKEIERRLTENKPYWFAEKQEEHEAFLKIQFNEGQQVLVSILEELKTIREMLREPEPPPPPPKPKPKVEDLSIMGECRPIIVEKTTEDIMKTVFLALAK